MTDTSTIDRFIFDRVKDEPADQVEDANHIDTKLLQVFSTASLLIGLSGFSAPSAVNYAAGGFMVAAIIAYGVAASLILSSLPLRLGRNDPNPNEMREHDADGVDGLERSLVEYTRETSRRKRGSAQSQAQRIPGCPDCGGGSGHAARLCFRLPTNLGWLGPAAKLERPRQAKTAA